MITAQDLIGTWRLVSYTFTTDEGQVIEPYGPAPVGQIMYHPDGGMAAHTMDAERPSVPRDLASLDGETAKTALAGYQSYCGVWHLDGDVVVHAVTAALASDWVGTDQRRDARLEGDVLTLGAQGIRLGGQPGRSVIVWRRR